MPSWWDSISIHKDLIGIGFDIEPGRDHPSYAFEHHLGGESYVYVKRKDDKRIQKTPLVLPPECISIRDKIDQISDVDVIWEPTKSTSFRRFPKLNGNESQYGYAANIGSTSGLSNLINAVKDMQSYQPSNKHVEFERKFTMREPLNQILYGPPGTGKTFSTMENAVQIADSEWIATTLNGLDATERRIRIKERYEQLVKDKRVEFVTFHQSFSYEDFIEGIRAKSDEESGSIRYDIEDGVFKQIAKNAQRSTTTGKNLGISTAPKVWKISIDRVGQSPIRESCFQKGEARIGWNGTGDLTQSYDERSKDEQAYWDKLKSKTHATITSFHEGIEIGDVLLCLKDMNTIQAVGIVTSEYWFDSDAADEEEYTYAHVRNVNWLLKDISLNILPINNNKRLVQQTVYQLDRISWDDLVILLNENGYSLPSLNDSDHQADSRPNYVLIIDEINRGNISRIFGELITLLEPDKRKGAGDERSTILPYSKEPFVVPDNLYVIGTMNTADKSLAQLDLALRRRFTFIEMPPKPDLLEGVEVYGIDIGEMLNIINQRIEVLLDRDHLIGHSYLLPLKWAKDKERPSRLADIFERSILPLLQEYFFDDWERIGWILNDPEKPEDHRFVKPGGTTPHTSLFSSKVVEQISDRRYSINPNAFTLPEAYKGIFSGST